MTRDFRSKEISASFKQLPSVNDIFLVSIPGGNDRNLPTPHLVAAVSAEV